MAEDVTTTEEQTSSDKMPFTGHLGEMRKRIFVSVITVFVLFAASFNFSEALFKILMIPMKSDMRLSLTSPYLSLVDKENPITTLIFLAPAEAFWVHLKISLIAGIILAMPMLFLQLWKFISPGLLPRERRYAFPFLASSSGLFFLGTLFCFFIVLPFAMGFLLNYKTGSLTPMISVEKYMDFTLKFLLAFGVVFELPLVLVFLTRMGIVTPQTLAKNRKYAVLLAFVAAAVLTPTPDAFNQSLMAGPIILLFEGGVLASRIFLRGKKVKDKDKEEDEDKDKDKDKEEGKDREEEDDKGQEP